MNIEAIHNINAVHSQLDSSIVNWIKCTLLIAGAGAGKQLADWIVDGRPSLDMSGYDIRRYCPKVSTRDSWIAERSHESYAKNYSMVFPHDEPLAARNAKKVSLYHCVCTVKPPICGTPVGHCEAGST